MSSTLPVETPVKLCYGQDTGSKCYVQHKNSSGWNCETQSTMFRQITLHSLHHIRVWTILADWGEDTAPGLYSTLGIIILEINFDFLSPEFQKYCHNPNSTSTQPQLSWVWRENEFAHPPHPTHPLTHPNSTSITSSLKSTFDVA